MCKVNTTLLKVQYKGSYRNDHNCEINSAVSILVVMRSYLSGDDIAVRGVTAPWVT